MISKTLIKFLVSYFFQRFFFQQVLDFTSIETMIEYDWLIM